MSMTNQIALLTFLTKETNISSSWCQLVNKHTIKWAGPAHTISEVLSPDEGTEPDK